VKGPVLYLHGFASGPESSKGAFFRRRFAELGVPVDLPDLAGGDFENLTITSQLEIATRRIAELGPELVIGSSLGGYLAALYAARHPGRVPRLALLAPGFGFGRLWPASLGEEQLRLYRQRGWMEVWHYSRKQTCRLSYRLVEDSRRYEDFPEVRDPTLLVHGTRDQVVNPALSQDFARDRPNIALHLLDSDHQLVDVLEGIWDLVVNWAP